MAKPHAEARLDAGRIVEGDGAAEDVVDLGMEDRRRGHHLRRLDRRAQIGLAPEERADEGSYFDASVPSK